VRKLFWSTFKRYLQVKPLRLRGKIQLEAFLGFQILLKMDCNRSRNQLKGDEGLLGVIVKAGARLIILDVRVGESGQVEELYIVG
jgi:hypothetical protein